MKVGDLVRRKWLNQRDTRLAIIVEEPSHHHLNIRFCDDGRKIPAAKKNLELVSESR